MVSFIMDRIFVNKDDLLTPKKLIEQYPNCGISPQQIGYLFKMGGLSGKRMGYTVFIYKESFERFLEYRKKLPKVAIV